MESVPFMNLEYLRSAIKTRLSERRYLHTLSVEKMTIELGRICLPDKSDELRAAALLHDVTKEISMEEHRNLLGKYRTDLKSCSPEVYHQLTAPLAIREEFPAYATTDILAGVRYHTTGRANMSTFEKIIFLADYIEETRTHAFCIRLREEWFRTADMLPDERLNRLVLAALEHTILYLKERNRPIDHDTIDARDAMLAVVSSPYFA